MVSLNFSVFQDKILNGEKKQTIRLIGGDNSPWLKLKPGTKLQLYSGMRTKKCKKLGCAVVDELTELTMFSRYGGVIVQDRNECDLPPPAFYNLIKNDGFQGETDFNEFFLRYFIDSQKSKRFMLIKWRNFEPYNQSKLVLKEK